MNTQKENVNYVGLGAHCEVLAWIVSLLYESLYMNSWLRLDQVEVEYYSLGDFHRLDGLVV